MGVGEGESRSPVSNRNSRKQEERTLREGGTENLTQEMGLKNTNHSTESRSRTKNEGDSINSHKTRYSLVVHFVPSPVLRALMYYLIHLHTLPPP